MHAARLAVGSLIVFYGQLSLTNALNDGAAPLPLMGWSTWNAFQCNVSDSLVRTSAQYLRNSALYTAGYNYILLDDCWGACSDFNSDGTCAQPAPRDSNNNLVPDPKKFPNGMASLVSYVHSLGLKFGIYSAPSAQTCAGFQGSLGYEDIDGQQFASWEVDFLKYDTCGDDCSIHTGCVQQSTIAISESLRSHSKASIKPVIYVDAGDPSNMNGVLNPQGLYVNDPTALPHAANRSSELLPIWGQNYAHMWKIWWDMWDAFESTMYNAHKQLNLELFQSCGSYNIPDMLTVGLGGQTMGEYRAQFFLWAVLGTPLILGNDIRSMKSEYLSLLTSAEIIAVNQDPYCLQGTLVQSVSSGLEVYVKMLSDGSFAVAYVNKDTTHTAKETFHLSDPSTTTSTSPAIYSAFWPASLGGQVTIRDIYKGKTVKTVSSGGHIHIKVPPRDALIYRFIPSGPQ